MLHEIARWSHAEKLSLLSHVVDHINVLINNLPDNKDGQSKFGRFLGSNVLANIQTFHTFGRRTQPIMTPNPTVRANSVN